LRPVVASASSKLQKEQMTIKCNIVMDIDPRILGCKVYRLFKVWVCVIKIDQISKAANS
jgi:hypothetical protein